MIILKLFLIIFAIHLIKSTSKIQIEIKDNDMINFIVSNLLVLGLKAIVILVACWLIVSNLPDVIKYIIG